MDAVNSFLTFIQGMISTVMGWGSSLFGALLPKSDATDEKKASFAKWALIVLGLFLAAKVFRVDLNIGGGSKGGGKRG